MIDLSEFTTATGRGRRRNEYAQRTYLVTGPKAARSSKLQMRLKLGQRVGEEVVRYFGQTCRVLVQPITGEIAICRGDSRRLTRSGGENGGCYCISLSSAHESFTENHGAFRRMFFDTRWENDERGNKFLYLEPNGQMERDA